MQKYCFVQSSQVLSQMKSEKMLRLRLLISPIHNYLRKLCTKTEKTNGNVSGPDDNNPINRTFRVLGNDLKTFFKHESNSPTYKRTSHEETSFQTHCDILVIGGGGVGSSVAYWLKQKARDGLNVVVVEKDPTYTYASTVLSVGGLRQQFSLPENIQMSLFGADFVRNSKVYLGDVNLNFTPYGYLTLASEEGSDALKRNSLVQNELGARNELLTAERLKNKFPWINIEGIALGCHGLEKEGWFDPWALLMGFKHKAQAYGAHFVNGELVNFEFSEQSDVIVEGDPVVKEGNYMALDKAIVLMPSGELRKIKFAVCVIAAGAQSAAVARLAKVGTGPGLLRVPLPVEPRKRYVYVINSQGENSPGLKTPLTIDPNGTYFRRDGLGANYLCGRSPNADAEPAVDNLNVDHKYFETDVWPTLAHRVKAFESAKVVGSWAGFYEYNVFDENGIIGTHPYYNNLYIATGFSGHGIQQTPAVGRAISELIIDGQFRTIDLTRLGFDRIVVDCPMFESNIV